MKLSLLLTLRPALLRQAHLAGLAFAYWKLSEFATRVVRARLRGEVNVKQAEPEAERFWATLTALAGNQSVIEEHFTEEDIMELADVIAFATGERHLDLTFRIEQLPEKFLAPLRHQLELAGVVIDHDFQPIGEPSRGGE